MSQTIFFSSGEPSGDKHTARLIRELRSQSNDFQFRGFGGPEMQSAGCAIDYELTQLAVMGVVEVIPKLRDFYAVANQASEVFSSGQIDAVVLVDFPGFNWHIAKRAKRHGIPVYYYLPPQLWAWAPWRIGKLRRNVDTVLSVLPFEHQWYEQRQIDSRFVGHPFFDAVADQKLDPNCLSHFAELEQQGERLVAVLPGSRSGEVSANWPLQLEVMRRIRDRHPDVRFLVACYRDRHCLACRDQMDSADHHLPIEFYVGKTSEIIEAAHCAVMVSGSVSLELMARKTPATILYRLGRIFHTLATTMIQVDSITLPNLIAGDTVLPETVSVGDPEPAIEFLVNSTDQMLSDENYYNSIVAELDRLTALYATPGASGRAAATLLQLFGQEPKQQKLAA